MSDSDLSKKPNMSGGELDEPLRIRRDALKALIQRERDVLDVLALSHDEATGLWVYLIQTPFLNSWPRYVIGATDESNEHPEVLFRCGSEWAARSEWAAMCKDDTAGGQP